VPWRRSKGRGIGFLRNGIRRTCVTYGVVLYTFLSIFLKNPVNPILTVKRGDAVINYSIAPGSLNKPTGLTMYSNDSIKGGYPLKPPFLSREDKVPDFRRKMIMLPALLCIR
jgi:hypothetical protein